MDNDLCLSTSLINSTSTLSDLNNSPSTNIQPQIQIKSCSQSKYEDDVEYVSDFSPNIPHLLSYVHEPSTVSEPRRSTWPMKGQLTDQNPRRIL